MKNYSIVGEFLKRKRIKSGLSQTELAQKLGYSTSQLVSNWERGICAARLESLPVLQTALHIPRKQIVSVYIKMERELMERAVK